MEALGWSSILLCWVISVVSLSFVFSFAIIWGTCSSLFHYSFRLSAGQSLCLVPGLTGGLMHFSLSSLRDLFRGREEGWMLRGKERDSWNFGGVTMISIYPFALRCGRII
jgi:hypothetical protein